MTPAQRALLERLTGEAPGIARPKNADRAAAEAFDALVDDLLDLRRLGLVHMPEPEEGFMGEHGRWSHAEPTITARGRRALRSAPLQEGAAELRHTLDDMAHGGIDAFPSTIDRLAAVVAPGAPLGELCARLPDAEFDAWLAAGMQTMKGQVGSATLRTPASAPDRLALQLGLIRWLADGDGTRNFHTFTYHFLYPPNANHDGRVVAFVERWARPFARDLLTLFKADIYPDGEPMPQRPPQGPAQSVANQANFYGGQHLSGAHARITVGTDQSTNSADSSGEEAFRAIERIADTEAAEKERAELRALVEEMRTARGREAAPSLYLRFVAFVGAHVKLAASLAPYLKPVGAALGITLPDVPALQAE